MDTSERTCFIEPSSYDLIVVGTGFSESLIAGAAARVGKTVLHIDSAAVYGAPLGIISTGSICRVGRRPCR
eukprot:jgi/Botrbrau1/2960/Bobra.0026s0028.1